MSHAMLMILFCLIFAAALLYSSVGHAGASGYLAAMALVGVAPETMRPVALWLNSDQPRLRACQFVQWPCR